MLVRKLGNNFAQATAVFVYCISTYADPAQRVVTNLLFGLVPWTVSCASYLVALQLVDICRNLKSMMSGAEPVEAEAPPEAPQSLAWLAGGRRHIAAQELETLDSSSLDTRFALLLAVAPSLAISIWLTKTYATGFTGVGTFFDVLALCLFVDVWRLMMHMAVVVAPAWTVLGGRRDDGQQAHEKIPGLFKLTWLLCIGWFAALLLMKRHATGVGFTDPIKTLDAQHSLMQHVACQVSGMYVQYILSSFCEEDTAVWLSMVWIISACMLLMATVFNATEPNTIGILAMVASIIHAASTFSESVPGCIAMMVASTAVTSMFVFFSVHYAEQVRDAIG
eukprot:g11875.t1